MKRFARHLSFQILAAIIPSLILLFSVPILASRLNTETFAGFSIVISMIGFLTVLDGGIGRSSTYFVKKTISQGSNSSLSIIVRACLLISFVFSLVMISGMWLLVEEVNGPSMLVARDAINTLILFTPAIVAGSVMKGVLEGQQKFVISSCLQMIQGLAVSITPIIIVKDIHDLISLSLAVGFVRLITLLMQIYFSKSIL